MLKNSMYILLVCKGLLWDLKLFKSCIVFYFLGFPILFWIVLIILTSLNIDVYFYALILSCRFLFCSGTPSTIFSNICAKNVCVSCHVNCIKNYTVYILILLYFKILDIYCIFKIFKCLITSQLIVLL